MSPNGGIVDVRHPRDVNFSCSTWIAATPGLRSRTRDSRNPAGPQYLQTATRTSLTSCRHPSTCRAERNPSATSRRSSTASGGRSTAIPRTPGFLTHNPVHPDWETQATGYAVNLEDLGAGPGPEPVSGVRRNCETFTACRKHAYRVLLNYQARARADFDGWEGLLRAVGRHLWRAIVRNCLRMSDSSSARSCHRLSYSLSHVIPRKLSSLHTSRDIKPLKPLALAPGFLQ